MNEIVYTHSQHDLDYMPIIHHMDDYQYFGTYLVHTLYENGPTNAVLGC